MVGLGRQFARAQRGEERVGEERVGAQMDFDASRILQLTLLERCAEHPFQCHKCVEIVLPDELVLVLNRSTLEPSFQLAVRGRIAVGDEGKLPQTREHVSAERTAAHNMGWGEHEARRGD